jgi:hypothetical protein
MINFLLVPRHKKETFCELAASSVLHLADVQAPQGLFFKVVMFFLLCGHVHWF